METKETRFQFYISTIIAAAARDIIAVKGISILHKYDYSPYKSLGE